MKKTNRCTLCQFCTIAFDHTTAHIVCNVEVPAYIVSDIHAIHCRLYKKLSKKQLGHRCHSCDALIDNVADFCYGCQKLVCDACATKYEHIINGKHGKLSKTK